MAELQSTLTCPHCDGVSTETMPTDACQYFYDCKHCGTVLKPLEGDCCVFCSYADLVDRQFRRREPAAIGGLLFTELAATVGRYCHSTHTLNERQL